MFHRDTLHHSQSLAKHLNYNWSASLLLWSHGQPFGEQVDKKLRLIHPRFVEATEAHQPATHGNLVESVLDS